MTRTPVPFDVGFSDAEVTGYEMDADKFIVRVNAWNEQPLTITFADPLGVADRGIGDISDFVQESSHSPFMQEVITRAYEKVHHPIPYYLFQFLDLDGEAALEVIATSAKICRTTDRQ